MTTADHETLAHTLHQAEGMVLLSTYPCDLYARLYRDWRVELRETHGDGATDRVESLYMNKACAEGQRQKRLIA